MFTWVFFDSLWQSVTMATDQQIELPENFSVYYGDGRSSHFNRPTGGSLIWKSNLPIYSQWDYENGHLIYTPQTKYVLVGDLRKFAIDFRDPNGPVQYSLSTYPVASTTIRFPDGHLSVG